MREGHTLEAMESLREALGMTAAEWETVALEWGLPRYRGRQVFDAIHRQGLRDYEGRCGSG